MGIDPADAGGAGQAGFSRIGEMVADSLRYWELRRILYNCVLGAVVLAHFAHAWPASRLFLKRDNLLGLFVLAVLANVAYCAAYVADVFVQLSGLRALWLRWRWLLLLLGIAFAGVLTHFFSQGMFTPSMND
jgi:drug/metabolite transporter (DMT)-like permease